MDDFERRGTHACSFSETISLERNNFDDDVGDSINLGKYLHEKLVSKITLLKMPKKGEKTSWTTQGMELCLERNNFGDDVGNNIKFNKRLHDVRSEQDNTSTQDVQERMNERRWTTQGTELC